MIQLWLVGSVSYLGQTTRPEASFSAYLLLRFFNNLGHAQWQKAKPLLPYLEETYEKGVKTWDLLACVWPAYEIPTRQHLKTGWLLLQQPECGNLLVFEEANVRGDLFDRGRAKCFQWGHQRHLQGILDTLGFWMSFSDVNNYNNRNIRKGFRTWVYPWSPGENNFFRQIWSSLIKLSFFKSLQFVHHILCIYASQKYKAFCRWYSSNSVSW